MALKFHSVEEITKIHTRLTETFQSGVTVPLAYRRKQLLQLARLVQENAEAIMGSLKADLGRHRLEAALPEVGPMVAGALLSAQKLEEWTKPEKPEVEEWRSSWDTTIYKAPKGVVVNITPWNYPWVISILPLAGAIAAGCTCVIKPSEHSPNVSQLMADLVARYLDPNAYAVILGAIPETTHILSLKWDHIFYTGSTSVGRVVAAAAAKNITPVTLELGGKSPVVVDGDNTDLEIAAKRILWGKQQNAGQICVAPDHIYVARKHQDALVAAFKKVYADFWPHSKGALDSASEISHMVNDSHYKRIQGLLSNTKGSIAVGGGSTGEILRIEPTIVKDVGLQDPLMGEEIFGPVLPIVPVEDIEEAITLIQRGPTPLVLYVFTDSEVTKHKFVHRTQSGQLILNDTFAQLGVYEIPFGGQGDSGYGSYLGKHSFDAFTQRRGFINVPLAAEPYMAFRYPPYTEEAFQALTLQAQMKIPEA
ncbi:hypothetical protein SERLA73DRAFT_188558 [Serpula lacrymans var. lacrymans S7.3]|uniref:Aldehyde dehydrogenase n=2 Tax=Serpula lacrymans var. lacrymans TaxID=341189 RepID=F8QBJ7_SERL3|nr:uncharacterized protein SERLADRAFT_478709 [Serpula lacrymans var. lacrymans S7.9]EGN94583.1 hypothetical protein SERLA73DRAFT_188558 [Serpula lacrymans var. lacrymans S7.3]EGO20059.1 hypothetical protein SERLADRAFT_478709 [Serpula lacrymans var. lacrymans S7.9]